MTHYVGPAMIALTIDQRPVAVPAGSTVLDAARQLGLDIPTLCHLPGAPDHRPSCMVCVVRIGNAGRLVPACATPATDGMVVSSETPDIHAARRAALELLFSDHLGDCVAICERVCPAQVPIPAMLRLAAGGELPAAGALAREHVVFPGVMGRVCRAPCQTGCRRGKFDGAVAIKAVERVAAAHELAANEKFIPACQPPTGQRVAIVGAGAAGLSAAFFLLKAGHACVAFDEHAEPGGTLRHGFTEQELPRAILDGEIDVIRRMGLAFRPQIRLGRDLALADLQKDFQAVILVVGRQTPADLAGLGVALTEHAIAVDAGTRQTSVPGVFAGGSGLRSTYEPVQSIGDGRRLARAVNRYLAGQPTGGVRAEFTCTIPTLDAEEYQAWAQGSIAALSPYAPVGDRAQGIRRAGMPRPQQQADAPVGDVAQAAGRCGQCDCRAADSCRLRIHAARYGVNPRAFSGEHRRRFALLRQPGGVLYEPGKCIACGICVQLTARAREPLGLAFIGRGFTVQVGVPLNGALSDALQKTAADVVRHCPTGALAFERKKEERSQESEDRSQ